MSSQNNTWNFQEYEKKECQFSRIIKHAANIDELNVFSQRSQSLNNQCSAWMYNNKIIFNCCLLMWALYTSDLTAEEFRTNVWYSLYMYR